MTAPMPYTLADVDGGAFTWDGDHEVLQRIRATVEALDAAQKRIAELEAELADAVDYGRGRHEAGRPSPPSPEALAKAMRGGMHAAFAQGGESVECACSSCTNRRAALAEWEKP